MQSAIKRRRERQTNLRDTAARLQAMLPDNAAVVGAGDYDDSILILPPGIRPDTDGEYPSYRGGLNAPDYWDGPFVMVSDFDCDPGLTAVMFGGHTAAGGALQKYAGPDNPDRRIISGPRTLAAHSDADLAAYMEIVREWLPRLNG